MKTLHCSAHVSPVHGSFESPETTDNDQVLLSTICDNVVLAFVERIRENSVFDLRLTTVRIAFKCNFINIFSFYDPNKLQANRLSTSLR